MPSRGRPTRRKRRAAADAARLVEWLVHMEVQRRVAALETIRRAVRRRKSLLDEGFVLL
jgi:hypothetical protein